MEAYSTAVVDLKKDAKQLISNEHFDSTNIGTRMVANCILFSAVILICLFSSQTQLDEQLSGLQMLVAARQSKLEESIKLHQYIHESDDVLSWITEKQQTAASEESGNDFEHLLVSCYDKRKSC